MNFVRRACVLAVLGVGTAASMAACETERPAPYLVAAPSSISPGEPSKLTRWDSMTELREWVEHPLTEGPFSMRSEGGIEFAQVELRPGVSSQLNGPSLDPVFSGLRRVRVRVRYVLPTADSTGLLHHVAAYVAPATRDDPFNPLIPSYFARATPTPTTWQVLDLLPEAGRGYPDVVDARWLYLAIGRNGEIRADVDWIELVR